MTTPAPLNLFNSLTRALEPFTPVHPGEARVYTCGPTVYNYPHIGNMRAYVFADILGRTLTYNGYRLTHIINITDVGHLTDDADAGEDKLEQAAAAAARSIWDIAQHYTEAFWADIAALNIRPPAEWSIASAFVPQMIAAAEQIAAQHCYELPGGLYFDTGTVADYGRLARAATDEGEGRIEAVEGKRHPADFAIWRRTPPGETRQMEWDSPWGRGAPGWHLECSVMSAALLGLPFDIHTGGIDHREIHHPNEIAQNQALQGFDHTHGGLDCAQHSGAKLWMHNNFLVARAEEGRSGKMSKSSGEFLRLQLLIDRGYHPMAYRMLCLQAHYRSELEFSWEGLGAALTRLKRLVMAVEKLKLGLGGRDIEAFTVALPPQPPMSAAYFHTFQQAIADDLNTALALTVVEQVIANFGNIGIGESMQLSLLATMDSVLGLNLLALTRADLRLRPKSAAITEAEIEATLAQRKEARAARDFAKSDALRAHLTAQGVEVMDGDPLGWDWKLS